MTREAILALISAREHLWRGHDSAGLAKAHAEFGIVEGPIFGKVQGRAAIEASYAEVFNGFGDSILELADPMVDGDRCVQIFTWHGTHTREMFGLPPTNRRFTVRGALFYEFKDGHIAHERRIYDFTGLLVQIGVLRPRTA